MVQPVELKDGVQQFGTHVEQAGRWEGVLDVQTTRTERGGWTVLTRWRYQPDTAWKSPTPRRRTGTLEVRFPESANEELGPEAVLLLTPTPWNDWG